MGISENTREAARRSVSESPHRRAASVQKRRIGPSILRILRGRIPVGGVSIRVQLHFVPRRRSAGAHHTFLSIPPGITLGQRGERSTSSKWRERGGAHCRPGVRDTRVPRALTASLSLLETNCQFHRQANCTWDREILVTVIIRVISRVRQLEHIKM